MGIKQTMRSPACVASVQYANVRRGAKEVGYSFRKWQLHVQMYVPLFLHNYRSFDKPRLPTYICR